MAANGSMLKSVGLLSFCLFVLILGSSSAGPLAAPAGKSCKEVRDEVDGPIQKGWVLQCNYDFACKFDSDDGAKTVDLLPWLRTTSIAECVDECNKKGPRCKGLTYGLLEELKGESAPNCWMKFSVNECSRRIKGDVINNVSHVSMVKPYEPSCFEDNACAQKLSFAIAVVGATTGIFATVASVYAIAKERQSRTNKAPAGPVAVC